MDVRRLRQRPIWPGAACVRRRPVILGDGPWRRACGFPLVRVASPQTSSARAQSSTRIVLAYRTFGHATTRLRRHGQARPRARHTGIPVRRSHPARSCARDRSPRVVGVGKSDRSRAPELRRVTSATTPVRSACTRMLHRRRRAYTRLDCWIRTPKDTIDLERFRRARTGALLDQRNKSRMTAGAIWNVHTGRLLLGNHPRATGALVLVRGPAPFVERDRRVSASTWKAPPRTTCRVRRGGRHNRRTIDERPFEVEGPLPHARSNPIGPICRRHLRADPAGATFGQAMQYPPPYLQPRWLARVVLRRVVAQARHAARSRRPQRSSHSAPLGKNPPSRYRTHTPRTSRCRSSEVSVRDAGVRVQVAVSPAKHERRSSKPPWSPGGSRSTTRPSRARTWCTASSPFNSPLPSCKCVCFRRPPGDATHRPRRARIAESARGDLVGVERKELTLAGWPSSVTSRRRNRERSSRRRRVARAAVARSADEQSNPAPGGLVLQLEGTGTQRTPEQCVTPCTHSKSCQEPFAPHLCGELPTHRSVSSTQGGPASREVSPSRVVRPSSESAPSASTRRASETMVWSPPTAASGVSAPSDAQRSIRRGVGARIDHARIERAAVHFTPRAAHALEMATSPAYDRSELARILSGVHTPPGPHVSPDRQPAVLQSLLKITSSSATRSIGIWLTS